MKESANPILYKCSMCGKKTPIAFRVKRAVVCPHDYKILFPNYKGGINES